LRTFPTATILRPSIVFGPEDSFFNRFADMAKWSPFLPLVGGGTSRFQPVHVDDVAAAVVHALFPPTASAAASGGRVFELGGPGVFTFRQLMELLLDALGTRRLLLPIPMAIAHLQAFGFETLHRLTGIAPMLTRDQLAMLGVDNVVSAGAAGFAELGVPGTRTACNKDSIAYVRRSVSP
jgi:uncharacterized protein YbjT (DUF2867 family)